MASTAQILATARGEIGTTERPPGSNRQKYGQWYGFNSVQWCSIFCCWVYGQNGVDLRKLVAPGYAACATALAGYQRLGWVLSNKRDARPADVVFFDFPGDGTNVTHHTGIVEINRGPFGLTTIEGNGLPNDTPVLTPTGWKRIADLVVGDEVLDPDGQPSTVTGVFPQGVRPVFEMELSDGRRLIADDQHRWKVKARGRSWTVLTTAEMAAAGTPHTLPSVAPAEFATSTLLPVDPWLLGVLIGDGSFRKTNVISLSCGEPDFAERILDAVGAAGSTSDHFERSYEMYGEYEPGQQYEFRGPLVENLKALGMWDLCAQDKVIPDEYLWASAKDRLALLQGLVDTDGHVDNWGRCDFVTTSATLAEQAAFLVRSLGGVTRIREYTPTYRRITDSADVRREGRTAYKLMNIRFPGSDIVPVTRSHKAERWRSSSHARHLRIVDVRPAGQMETTCISVSAPSRLFMVEDFIPTHNTSGGGSQTNGGAVMRKQRSWDLVKAIARVRVLTDSPSPIPWPAPNPVPPAPVTPPTPINNEDDMRIFKVPGDKQNWLCAGNWERRWITDDHANKLRWYGVPFAEVDEATKWVIFAQWNREIASV